MGKVMCRLCSKAVKSVAHVLAGRTALAQNKVAHAPRLITKYTNTNVFTAAAATSATATTIRNSDERSSRDKGVEIRDQYSQREFVFKIKTFIFNLLHSRSYPNNGWAREYFILSDQFRYSHNLYI